MKAEVLPGDQAGQGLLNPVVAGVAVAFSSAVRSLAQEHIQELERKLANMHAMQATLEHLVHCCHGDDRPECPILETLATPVDTPEKPHAHHGRRGALRVGTRGG